MLLTLTTTHYPATELGFLLHKHPDKSQSFPLPFGQAHVFYPEASPERCTAALLLEVDPVGLTRRGHQRGSSSFALQPYINDRPYVASSLLSVALARVFGSALNGVCKTRPELISQPLPLEATLSALPCPGGDALLRLLFEPLGYEVLSSSTPLEPAFPAWGESPSRTVTLRQTLPLARLLRHLYIMTPVLDDKKHYWVDDAELQKLLDKGEGWLEDHPERERIVRRYLRHQQSLAQSALAQLGGAEAAGRETPGSETPDTETSETETSRTEIPSAQPAHESRAPGLHEQRLEHVCGLLRASGAARVLDLGCGEGKLLHKLLREPQFTEVVGTDVSLQALDGARRRLELDKLPLSLARRLRLLHTSLLYRDRRLVGFDAAAVVEVVEHLEPSRLSTFERILFGFTRPKLIVLSTPNRDYNAVWPHVGSANLRHPDHRFEWSREAFRRWATQTAETYGYHAELSGVGPETPEHGHATQVGVFREA